MKKRHVPAVSIGRYVSRDEVSFFKEYSRHYNAKKAEVDDKRNKLLHFRIIKDLEDAKILKEFG